jgi:hypothetical protein
LWPTMLFMCPQFITTWFHPSCCMRLVESKLEYVLLYCMYCTCTVVVWMCNQWYKYPGCMYVCIYVCMYVFIYFFMYLFSYLAI